MKFTVLYTQRARDDIFRNASWWAEHHSLDKALEWELAVQTQIQSLEKMPQRHGVAPENDQFVYEIRQMLVGLGPNPSYRAIYKVDDREVLELAVRRGAEKQFEV